MVKGRLVLEKERKMEAQTPDVANQVINTKVPGSHLNGRCSRMELKWFLKIILMKITVVQLFSHV